MAREKKPPEAKAGCPEWLATYGDLVTLVLTFFVLLFSFSTIDAQKWKSVVSSLSGNPSIFDGLDYSANPMAENSFKPGAENSEVSLEYLISNSDEWAEIANEIYNIIAKANDEGTSQAEMTADATHIRIELSGDVLFDSGKADLKIESMDVLLDVIEQLRGHLPLVGFLKIEGHTDNVPITYPYRNNMALSTARAGSVFDYLMEGPLKDDSDFPPSMFQCAGYSEYQPIDTNDTPEGRQRNRRVTFCIDRDEEYNTSEPQTVSPDDIPQQ